MRIAVTSQNFRTITGHAGKCRRFLVFGPGAADAPEELQRLDLPMEMALHEHRGQSHPLFELGLTDLITQGAGPGFIRRLAAQGIRVHVTSATDPIAAVRSLLTKEPLPQPLEGACRH
ncbi:NifB/NifX family molybdenum-iron cluster-binding protein [Ectothiorhodospira shaposhnikovii]|uniref:NifB/NifX family molybdenum-iron cluster-binding protein n=1 Tax=Ectothiorhodospira shaposhnikovii TaxID=1054 RepID=UPI001EE7FB53|nr:nitrogen fixation protein [Ectothiorhodospira shaposhnikovii]MCG5513081.1 nitrogen fixation protein [Ectothiorhodospira shaposhnikovii]